MSWQPIETAPKDGSNVLLYETDDIMFVGWWSDIYDVWFASNGGDDPEASHVTHWMPLPEPPK